MATAKIVFFKGKVKSDGRHPIMLRVTKNRKSDYLCLDWVYEKDWDFSSGIVSKTHPNSSRLNNFLTRKKLEAEDLIYELSKHNEVFTARRIISTIKGHQDQDFLKFSQNYLNELKKQNKHSRYSADSSRFKMIQAFFKGRTPQFHELNVKCLHALRTYFISNKKVSERTSANALILIRTIYNRAISEGLVDRKYYPFGKGKFRIKFPETIKIGLNEKEIGLLENLNLEPYTNLWHTRNVFLISFYFAGMRVSDLLKLKWSDINDNRLYYKMSKNQKTDSLLVPKKAEVIISLYRNNAKSHEEYIFPELNVAKKNDSYDIHRKIRTANKKFNDYLKKLSELTQIEKKLTMHIARHSFGNIAGDKISPQMLQKLYRHTSLTTTVIYQGNFIHKSADEALKSVIGE